MITLTYLELAQISPGFILTGAALYWFGYWMGCKRIMKVYSETFKG